MNKKTMAGTALGISLLGAASTAPISTASFLGGLVHHGFLAASIGGLADWFAVTALFRKPLGISYRTEILTRNRQRIMQAVVDFAGNDLLNVDNIMKFIEQKKLSDMLLLYFQGNERQEIMKNVNVIVEETLQSIDYKMLSQKLTPIIAAQLQGEKVEALVEKLTAEINHAQLAAELLPLLAATGHRILEDEAIVSIIKDNLEQVLKEYEGNGAGRAFVMALAGLDANSLWKIIKEKAEDTLDELTCDDAENKSNLRQIAIDFLSEQIYNLIRSKSVVNTISNFITQFASEDNIEKIVTEFLSKQLLQRKVYWQEQISEMLIEKMDEFCINEDWQLILDQQIKGWLRSQLVENHHLITDMIEERLVVLTDEQLVEFIEPKVSDDLQMIRINGSIVGGIAGMALFIVTYLAGQVLAR